MLVKTKAIVIATIKYQEKSLIVKCLTASSGLVTYFVKNAFTGKNNTQKKAFFQPLNLLEIEAYHKKKGGFNYFRELKIATPYKDIPFSIYKTTIALFLSEVLHNSIKEEEKNENLFTFLETALLWLDNHEKIANFHLITLLELTKYFGFFPENNALDYFNLQEGIFVTHKTANCLSKNETHLFKQLFALSITDECAIFSGKQRYQLLEIILDYYNCNIENFKKPQSLQVLKEVFA